MKMIVAFDFFTVPTVTLSPVAVAPHERAELKSSWERARSEAQSAFGDDHVYVVERGQAFAGLGPVASTASSHREAPLVSADPPIDATDLYAFVSPDDDSKVTVIASWLPFEEPAGGEEADAKVREASDASGRMIYEGRDFNVNGSASEERKFTWDEQGKRLSETFLYKGNIAYEVDYSYDTAGRLATVIFDHHDDPSFWLATARYTCAP